ncbi:MAG TPA: LamG-like jellyroll fold domain-containing protein [Polyangiaceae bacterium]|nr:LamG-like jellyroll fold domain-containing protein [Polyangiaceae bacterium]
MRAAALPVLGLPLLLTYCGSREDLVIGHLQKVVAGQPSVIPGGGSGAAAGTATAGSESGGNGGSQSGAGDGNGTLGGAGAEQGGAPDSTAGGAANDCVDGDEPPPGTLLHRYSFDGTGNNVVDSVGTANGTTQGGAVLDGSGVLTLAGNRDGQPDQYVDLADHLISSLTEVTIVAWTTWAGGAGYQRVFDFGISDTGVGQGNSGKSYIAVMPSTGFANGTGLGAEIAAPGYPTLGLPSAEMMKDRPAVVGFTLKSGQSVGLYLDGKLLIEAPTTFKLSAVDDRNDFVGESQWSKDHCYHGSFDELRVYSVALTACQQRTLVQRGPNTL